MRVHCCQFDIVWESKAANHARVRALLDEARLEPGDLVLLPEMFATGFSMRLPEITDSLTKESHEFLARTAAAHGIHLLGGVVTTAPGAKGRNECVAYAPNGTELARYTKMHPFTYGGESRFFDRGEAPRPFECGDAVVAPFICYDLRFPEIFRSAVARGATLMAVIANWPSAREEHWVALLKARAIENQAYVAGVNRSGSDPNLSYPGRSMIVDPHGRVIAEAGRGEEVIHAELDIQALRDYRREFPALADISPGFVKVD